MIEENNLAHQPGQILRSQLFVCIMDAMKQDVKSGIFTAIDQDVADAIA